MKKIITFLFIGVAFFFPIDGCTGNINSYIQVAHIIDADRGIPYNLLYDSDSEIFVNDPNCISSATIVSDDSARADAYATAVCVMGLEKGIEFLESKNLNAVLFTRDKRMAIVGNVAITDSEYEEYKDYELYYGRSAIPTDDTIAAEYSENYRDYRGNIFANTIEYRLTLMGTDTETVKNKIFEQWEAIEKAVSLADRDSELSKFNSASAGEQIEISELTFEMLEEAIEVYKETDGAFNPSVVDLSGIWNVDIDGIKQYRPYPGSDSRAWKYPDRLPTMEEIESIKAICSMDNLVLEREQGKFYALKRVDGLKLDMGGIAKGYAVNIARDICRENGITSAIINISGNIYLINSKVDGEVLPWTVNITSPTEINPFFRGIIAQISLPGNVSIVTSGDYQRFYFYGYEE